MAAPSLAAATEIAAITAEQALAPQHALVVDLRAPLEFDDDHLAGACNVPLFDDPQRALIGTLYNKLSPESAFEEGRASVLRRVREIVERIAKLAGRPSPTAQLEQLVDQLTRGGLRDMERRLVARAPCDPSSVGVLLCCQRGGLRSRSVAALLARAGWSDVAIVAGGYKAVRRVVVDRLARWTAPPAFVLRGLTGVGKSLVLREIERLRPGWTVDLEGLARHRSSILGGVGLEPVSQRTFETRIHERVAHASAHVMILEGESRKVGDVIVPPALWRALSSGVSLELVAPIERRIDVLLDDYLREPRGRAQLAEKLGFLEQRLGEREWDGVLTRMLEQGRERDLARLLLERYYDPRYRHSEQGRKHAATFDAGAPEACARALVTWIETALAARNPG